MGAYDTFFYDDDFYDTPTIPPKIYKRTFLRIPLGLCVRKKLKGKFIFRIRPGNGYHGAQLGIVYHDKYFYFVPSSINNPQGQPARNAFIQAQYNWKNVLTDEQKADYNKKAKRTMRHSGRNIYVGEYISANA